MKTIYTSNYARIKQFTEEYNDAHIVGTSVWIPRWFVNKCHQKRRDIAPTWEMVKAIKDEYITKGEYEEMYLQLLTERKIDPYKLIDELPNNTFLLCFESPTDFCHRHILSDWIRVRTGFEIIEWKNKREREKEAKKGNLESLIEL